MHTESGRIFYKSYWQTVNAEGIYIFLVMIYKKRFSREYFS